MINVETITKEFAELIEESSLSKPNLQIAEVCDIQSAKEQSLVFANKESFLQEAIAAKPACIVTNIKFKESTNGVEGNFIFTQLPDLLVTFVLQKYFYQNPRHDYQVKLSESARVNLKEIPLNLSVGENSYIAETADIGSNVFIGSNVIISENVSIGDNTVIMDQSWIGENTTIGKDCFIRSASSIGTDSFEAKVSGKQCNGSVLLEDKVETGSQVCIDRPIEGRTHLKAGVKLDNMVKIADKVILGENCLITAGVQIGSGAKIGRFFMVGGNSYIDKNIEICDGVMCGGMTYVDSDIIKPGAYGGNPYQPMRAYLKSLSSLAQLPKLRKLLQTR